MTGLAVALWILTAFGGLGLFGFWYRTARQDPTRSELGMVERGAITTGKVAPHVALVLAGLALWAAALTVDDDEPATPARVLALALLVAGMTVGVAMVREWRTKREDSRPDAAVPAAAVVAHGLLAVVTLVLAVVAVLAAR